MELFISAKQLCGCAGSSHLAGQCGGHG